MNRVVVGAHYGLRDWLVQRISAVIIASYVLFLLIELMTSQPMTHATWKHLFGRGSMQVATLLFGLAFAWHTWIGMRDISMDYVKSTGLRLALQTGAALAIAWYFLWLARLILK